MTTTELLALAENAAADVCGVKRWRSGVVYFVGREPPVNFDEAAGGYAYVGEGGWLHVRPSVERYEQLYPPTRVDVILYTDHSRDIAHEWVQCRYSGGKPVVFERNGIAYYRLRCSREPTHLRDAEEVVVCEMFGERASLIEASGFNVFRKKDAMERVA